MGSEGSGDRGGDEWLFSQVRGIGHLGANICSSKANAEWTIKQGLKIDEMRLENYKSYLIANIVMIPKSLM